MKYVLTCCLFLVPFALQADIGTEILEVNNVEEKVIAQDDQSDLYDRQYNLNPLPQSPRRTVAASSCQDSAQLSQQVNRLEKRVNALEKKISALEPSEEAIVEKKVSALETSAQEDVK